MITSRRTALAALALGALVGGRRRAAADERPPRRVGLHREGGVLAVSVGLSDLFVPQDDERLHSGFATRVLIRAELLRETPRGSPQVVGAAVRSSEIAYDLWDERFRVSLWDGTSATPRVHEIATAREAVFLATALVRFPLVPLDTLDPRTTYHLRFRVDLNPISEEAAGEVRRWLVRPPGQGRASSDSVFGSFVSIFVNPRIEESERQIVVLSLPFLLSPPPPAPSRPAAATLPQTPTLEPRR